MEERGDEDRDLGIPNSRVNYNPPQIIQKSQVVKLPLAPIVATPQDRRPIATLSTRRGISIFSPTQTLDYHRHRHRQPVNPPPPLCPTPDPDPTDSAPPPPPPPPPPASITNNTGIRYRECLKNHAASMGSHVVDGCGEFMPSGEEGTSEAMRCAACDCHRNFHRKEAEGDAPPPNPPPEHAHYGPAMVNFGGAADESSSEDLNNNTNMFHQHAEMQRGSKKRFRTKFSHEQKERMQELAEKIGWRIQKQDEEQVQKLCHESGVKRQVFKVWMHNNKQALKKRQSGF